MLFVADLIIVLTQNKNSLQVSVSENLIETRLCLKGN